MSDLLRAFLTDHDWPCPSCGYNLRNLAGPTCPECGTGLELSVGGADPFWPRRRLITWAWVMASLGSAASLAQVLAQLMSLLGSALPAFIYVRLAVYVGADAAMLLIGLWCLTRIWKARGLPRNQGPWRRASWLFLLLPTLLAVPKLFLAVLTWLLW